MRKIKLFVIALLVLFSLLSLAALLLPSRITISKTVFIDATEKNIATRIENFDQWKYWHPFFQDAAIHIDLARNNDTSIAKLTNKDGRKLILALSKPAPGQINIMLSGEKSGTETYEFFILPGRPAGTQLTWDINITLSWYPWVKFSGMFYDKIKGPQYEAILNNLKAISEVSTQ